MDYKKKISGAILLIKCLEAHEVEYIFGIPGAKIDAVFDALNDSPIKLVLCRHEQNAAFMAACYGRLTGKPGVVLVTSGPGVANLSTGLLTATTEGDPIVALGGNVERNMLMKASHQNTQNVELMTPVTKSAVEIVSVDTISEAIANAFRTATLPRAGATFISLPKDVLYDKTPLNIVKQSSVSDYGQARNENITQLASLLTQSSCPVLLIGEEGTKPENANAIRALLDKITLPTVCTYQGAGVVSRKHQACFAGRIGLFQNQPGDQLLKNSDLILAVGFNRIEYDPEIWNQTHSCRIIHIDYRPATLHFSYQPEMEIVGDIAINLRALKDAMPEIDSNKYLDVVAPYNKALKKAISGSKKSNVEGLVHPLDFINALRETIDDSATVICDVGSVYMWMARYFLSFRPRQLLFSNGQQTLGVGLPWAIAANFAKVSGPIISISGDGGFLFSAMELETAVRFNHRFVHFVWRDNCYNMVMEQEKMKYQRKSGVDFGEVDIESYATAFGAKGCKMTDAAELPDILKRAESLSVPLLVDVPINYQDNPALFKISNAREGN
jgi:acetolactate synthase-1/2/3 large subunit